MADTKSKRMFENTDAQNTGRQTETKTARQTVRRASREKYTETVRLRRRETEMQPECARIFRCSEVPGEGKKHLDLVRVRARNLFLNLVRLQEKRGDNYI